MAAQLPIPGQQHRYPVAITCRQRRVVIWDQRGFGRSTDRAGRSGPESAGADLAALVSGVVSDGCDCGAPLEAWYRFLIDPEPPERLVVSDGVVVVKRGDWPEDRPVSDD